MSDSFRSTMLPLINTLILYIFKSIRYISISKLSWQYIIYIPDILVRFNTYFSFYLPISGIIQLHISLHDVWCRTVLYQLWMQQNPPLSGLGVIGGNLFWSQSCCSNLLPRGNVPHVQWWCNIFLSMINRFST